MLTNHFCLHSLRCKVSMPSMKMLRATTLRIESSRQITYFSASIRSILHALFEPVNPFKSKLGRHKWPKAKKDLLRSGWSVPSIWHVLWLCVPCTTQNCPIILTTWHQWIPPRIVGIQTKHLFWQNAAHLKIKRASEWGSEQRVSYWQNTAHLKIKTSQ